MAESTDTRLRALERRYHAERTPGAEAAWLSARCAAGERCALPCECVGDDSECDCYGPGYDGGVWDPHPKSAHGRCDACDGTGRASLRSGLELLAYVGDPAARLAVPDWPREWAGETSVRAWAAATRGRHVPCLPTPAEWLRGLARWGDTVLVRAALAAGREVWADGFHNGRWLPGLSLADYDNARRALETAEAWLADPSEANRDRWRAAVPTWPPEWLPLAEPAAGPAPDLRAAEVIHAARALGPDGEQRVRDAIRRALWAWLS